MSSAACHCRLENALRNFACLTTGDVIAINYNEKVEHFVQTRLICKWVFWVTRSEVVVFFQIYELRVMETKPDKAVSIIECDMNVRSQTTLGYSFVFSAENSTCFSGGFWCSFGLQRTWTAASSPRGTKCKDSFPLKLNAMNKLIQWMSLQEGEDHSSYADMDTGFRVSRCSCSVQLSAKSSLTDGHYVSTL